MRFQYALLLPSHVIPQSFPGSSALSVNYPVLPPPAVTSGFSFVGCVTHPWQHAPFGKCGTGQYRLRILTARHAGYVRPSPGLPDLARLRRTVRVARNRYSAYTWQVSEVCHDPVARNEARRPTGDSCGFAVALCRFCAAFKTTPTMARYKTSIFRPCCQDLFDQI